MSDRWMAKGESLWTIDTQSTLRISQIRKGFRTGDAQRILSVYLDGFADLSDGYPSFGREESKTVFEERLKQVFARYHTELAPVSMFIDIAGDQAVDCGWHELRLRSKLNGNSIRIRTRYIEVWKRSIKGTWAIALFLDNLNQTPMLVGEMLEATFGRIRARRLPKSSSTELG